MTGSPSVSFTITFLYFFHWVKLGYTDGSSREHSTAAELALSDCGNPGIRSRLPAHTKDFCSIEMLPAVAKKIV